MSLTTEEKPPRSKNPFKPKPAPPAFGEGKPIPEASSIWISRLFLHWIGAFLNVGYSRPLEKEDLWELPPARQTHAIADTVEKAFYTRCPPENRPRSMRSSLPEPVVEQNTDPEKGDAEGKPAKSPYDKSLFKALMSSFAKRTYFAVALVVCADTLVTTVPLVNKVLLTWLAESFAWAQLSDDDRSAVVAAGLLSQPRGIGFGIGLAFAIFAMQLVASMMTHHSLLMAMTTGIYMRTGVIGAIFRKALRLSGKARSEHGVGKITTMISTDATNLEFFVGFSSYLVSSPIQLILGIGLLIGTLGYSALVGLGVFIVTAPFQGILVAIMMQQREKGVKIMDQRVRLMTEVLQGIRLIKIYGWEKFYMEGIIKLRAGEIKTIRKGSVAVALMFALFYFTPILAAVLSFITYALTGHDLNIATIFAALQLFNIIRIPLIVLPVASQSLAQALVALERMSTFLVAEELPEAYILDKDAGPAVYIDGDFQWETVKPPSDSVDSEKDAEEEKKKKEKEEKEKKKEEKRRNKAKSQKKSWWSKAPTEAEEEQNEKAEGTSTPPHVEKPFGMNNLKMTIPHGAFVAIVGRVGCGKSSILQALLGEMRRTRGEIIMGGSLAYAPQTPWIKNASLRQNVTFGKEDDEQRFREVVKACALERDLGVLPQGEYTEIGEKGINLSGGQKARVSLARAAYSDAPIVLLDDPFAAVDAYVGKHLLEKCLLSGPLAGRTRILVTHALHVLERADYIYVMGNGTIVEEGEYKDLVNQSGVFAKLIEDFGSTSEPKAVGRPQAEQGDERAANAGPGKGMKVDPLMQLEERSTGAVSSSVYKRYLMAAGGLLWIPLIMACLLFNEGSNVSVTLFLGFWTSNHFPHFTSGTYMGVYAALGGALAVASFFTTYAFVTLGLSASMNMLKASFTGVMLSPVRFFDTTPMGRILSRFSKDQDAIDAELPIMLTQFLTMTMSIFGLVGLVFYVFPWLGIIFVPLIIIYHIMSLYYRASSIETKRLDSLLRSVYYSSFSETLTGVATIRAYNGQDYSTQTAERGLDVQNRAAFMTVAMQRWLALRLDLFGNLVVLGIALFGTGFRATINPAKTGVVLTYTLGVIQSLSELITSYAQIEQSMNCVERILHYSELPTEDFESGEALPPDWPPHGAIEFKDVQLRYRDGLPLVLKGVNFSFRANEKVAIVGRTGSGKSSLIQALFRMVEVDSGSILIDGTNISAVRLEDLRHRLASVPQDTTLFLGTLRDNIDPQRLRTDAELISVLQRCWLVPKDGKMEPGVEAKFSLDSPITDEGANYSAGEKQLLALARALVKNSKIIVLDEATSSVDVETDAKIQRTINQEFSDSTLLCIAHRINTIAHYDRVLVMDDGKVAEFDTVLNLYDSEQSIFRSLCEEASLNRDDILKIRQDFKSQTS